MSVAAALAAPPLAARAAGTPEPPPAGRDVKTAPSAQDAPQPKLIKRDKRIHYTIPARKRSEDR